MKRFSLLLLVGLCVVLLAVACRSDGGQESTRAPVDRLVAESNSTDEPAQDAIATAVEGTVQARLAGRGGETAPDATPSASPDRVDANSGPEEPSSATDQPVFLIPFEVQPDGFSFRNYGAGFPEGRFTIADLREQFGDGVCSRIDREGDTCIPTAAAQQWIDDRNADMSYGHCIGFTVASYRFAEGAIRPAAFTPGAQTTFDISKTPEIMRTIAANGALYWAESVWSSEIGGTPREVLDALIELGEPADLSIYLPGLVGGHSLLAYGVKEVAPDQYQILVYDNNFPGVEAFVEVDYAANTWRYDQGAVNPDQTAVPYEGDATTNTLRFIPLSAYDDVSCPFCTTTPNGEDDEAFTLLTFLGQGEVLVKTALGTIGVVAGELINDIPGATFILQRGQLAATDAPDIVLPAGLDYTVEFTDMERVSSLNRNYSIVLDELTPAAEQSTLAVTLAEQAFAYRAGGAQSPVIRSTVRQDEATYSVALLGVEFAGGQGLTMGINEGSQGLAISSSDAAIDDGTLLITRLTEEDEAIFATTSLNIVKGGQVALDIATWDGSGRMDVYLDDNGDGTYAERPARLTNTRLTDVLRLSDRGLAARVIDKVSPYLGADGLLPVLSGLATQRLPGQAIGEILQPLTLTNDQLSELIISYALPIDELGPLLFALRREPDQLEAIILSLGLDEEDELALRTLLEELALIQSIINDWVFLNSADMTRLAQLLNGRQLSVTTLGQLLPRLGLTQAQLELLLGALDLSDSDLGTLAEQLGIDLQAIVRVTPAAGPARATRAATAIPGTATTTPTVTPTSRVVATATPTVRSTRVATATPDGGTAPPRPTATPAPYPYPGAPVPPPTRTPAPYPYPGPNPTATPKFQSRAFCEGDDLLIIAEEPSWADLEIEIWSGDSLLIVGQIGADGEPFEVSFDGPGTWEDLHLISTQDPTEVDLGSVTCP